MTNKTPLPYINQGDKVILFDGVCKLCNGWAKFIIKYDKQHLFKLASVQSKQGQVLLRYFETPTHQFYTINVSAIALCYIALYSMPSRAIAQ